MSDETGGPNDQTSGEQPGWTPPPAVSPEASKVREQVQGKAGLGGPAHAGGGTIFTEPVLVVNQKMKLIELVQEYKVFDQHGTEIGAVCEVGQTTLKKAVRLLSSLDQFFTHSYEIRDAQGVPQLVLIRPRKIMKSRFQLTRADGSPVGEIQQKNMLGKIKFALTAGGREVGSLNAENWRAWNFNIQDSAGLEIARVTKTWEGLAKTMFTTADNYVVQLHRPLEDPLRSLVIAAALCIDTALKQDSRGLT